MLRETLLVFAAIIVLAAATKVSECDNGRLYKDANQVQITGCDDPPCKLKRKTKVVIEQAFVAPRDIESLTTRVYATILGIPLPFIGVDGGNACDNVYTPDGTKVGCPLKQNTQYVYKNEFPILDVYPKVALVVHWSLVEKDNVVTCFEVPSKITP